MDWTEKYRPQSLDSVVGNPTAVNTMRAWAKSWTTGIPEKRALVLMGSPGVGKTTSAEALAREMGWDTVEMNSSDQRTGSAIENVAIRGSMFNTFGDDGSYMDAATGARKLIILDEADSLFGNADRGAMPVINRLIKETSQPVILIVNDFYELKRKSSVVANNTLQITFKKPTATTVTKTLYRIAEAEGVEVEPAAMELLVSNANGDLRAAVRNLESLSLGVDEVTLEMAEGLSSRESRSDMYELMTAVFRKDDVPSARRIYSQSDTDPQTTMLWMDENMPYEFPDRGDLVRGYEMLSRADIFLGRVHKRQYYGFWSYAGDLMTAGVISSRWTDRYSRERIRFPMYLSKMSRSKSVRALKGSTVMKLAVYLHTSTRRVSMDILHPLKTMMSNDRELCVAITRGAELEPEELGFLLDKKPDSKDVKAIFSELETKPVTEKIETDVPKSKPKNVPSVEPPASAPTPAASKPKGQRSLFDF